MMVALITRVPTDQYSSESNYWNQIKYWQLIRSDQESKLQDTRENLSMPYTRMQSYRDVVVIISKN